ncbi:hypothetical protein [Singulisphaera sp. PoT]|uniref:hypothetical protein n=1 Tax=Singulisphaera sp. PoT TaxID=3411797 RepID=UPI003BF4FC8E
MRDEERILRERHSDLAIAVDRTRYEPRKGGQMLVQVQDCGSLPTEMKKYYCCKVIDPGGAEVEGQPGGFDPLTGRVYVIAIGDKVPVVDDYLLASAIGGRWVAESYKSPTSGASLCLESKNGCNADPFDPGYGYPLPGFVFTLTDPDGEVYGPSDATTGKVLSVSMVTQGTGFDPLDPPAVAFGTPGADAKATANLSGGVPTIKLTAGGDGYTDPVITMGGYTTGNRASIAWKLTITSLVLQASGSDYDDGVDYDLIFVGGGTPTTPAQGKFDVVDGVIVNVRLTNGGVGYRSAPAVTFTDAGDGNGGKVKVKMKFTEIRATGGTLYVNPTLTIDDPDGDGATATVTATSIGIASVTVTDGGHDYSYTSPPAITFPATSGSGATAQALVRIRSCIEDLPTDLAFPLTIDITQPGYVPGHETINTFLTGPYKLNLWPVGTLTVRVISWFMAPAGIVVTGSVGNHSDTQTMTLVDPGSGIYGATLSITCDESSSRYVTITASIGRGGTIPGPTCGPQPFSLYAP